MSYQPLADTVLKQHEFGAFESESYYIEKFDLFHDANTLCRVYLWQFLRKARVSEHEKFLFDECIVNSALFCRAYF